VPEEEIQPCPLFGESPRAGNLINMRPGREWGRGVVARYPNRQSVKTELGEAYSEIARKQKMPHRSIRVRSRSFSHFLAQP
jgi:hypothetical protein